MVKTAFIGALAPLVLLAGPARADFRTPIAGAEPALPSAFVLTVHPAPRRPHILAMPGAMPILPSRFTPMQTETGLGGLPPLPAPAASPLRPLIPAVADASEESQAAPALAPAFSLPLVDRRLSETERSTELAPELQDAILRIEPVYDQTRLDGPDAEIEMHVSAGTAAMDNVFADHWRLATPDPNVNARVAYLATTWQMTGRQPCAAFSKARPHTYGEAALGALGGEDCRRLLRYEAVRYDRAPPIPVAIAAASLPVFAAPMPGSRMSSRDFWAAQKARIEAIQASLHDKWQGGTARVGEIGLRP